ncbi:uncharacterized protein G2W53_018749 [Senna tora]|uniref:Uncharacterized protein n=1 Tax=Senna tora TaxID=362788 RepID=A0A834WLD0_9FABA|nr:uncharacterized protein G2W53_018749 [Senna tora]
MALLPSSFNVHCLNVASIARSSSSHFGRCRFSFSHTRPICCSLPPAVEQSRSTS